MIRFLFVCECRAGLFTPNMAFEAIVKRQIDKLRAPAVKCVDLVMSELMNVIKKCSSNVSKFHFNLYICFGVLSK